MKNDYETIMKRTEKALERLQKSILFDKYSMQFVDSLGIGILFLVSAVSMWLLYLIMNTPTSIGVRVISWLLSIYFLSDFIVGCYGGIQICREHKVTSKLLRDLFLGTVWRTLDLENTHRLPKRIFILILSSVLTFVLVVTQDISLLMRVNSWFLALYSFYIVWIIIERRRIKENDDNKNN